jgi:addiction module HigA family antidote
LTWKDASARRFAQSGRSRWSVLDTSRAQARLQALNAAKTLAGIGRLKSLGLHKLTVTERGISPETALRLGRYSGNEPEFWLSMQTTYDLSILRKERGARIAAEVEVAA